MSNYIKQRNNKENSFLFVTDNHASLQTHSLTNDELLAPQKQLSSRARFLTKKIPAMTFAVTLALVGFYAYTNIRATYPTSRLSLFMKVQVAYADVPYTQNSYAPAYTQSGYYSQGTYGPGYTQSTYVVATSTYSQGMYYTQSTYYSQGTYGPGYTQSTYYSQGTYYTQSMYYTQGKYYTQGTYSTGSTGGTLSIPCTNGGSLYPSRDGSYIWTSGTTGESKWYPDANSLPKSVADAYGIQQTSTGSGGSTPTTPSTPTTGSGGTTPTTPSYYSQSKYYSQSGYASYYTQSKYYSQNGYAIYSQSKYYSQGGYYSQSAYFSCFTGDQLVTTRNGLVPISQITIGTEVISYDEDTDTFTMSVVGEVKVHTKESEPNDFSQHALLAVTIVDAVATKTTSVTSNHRYFSPTTKTYKEIGLFKVGDSVLTQNGIGTVTNTETLIDGTDAYESTFVDVYNLHMSQGPANYLVNDVVVHNIK